MFFKEVLVIGVHGQGWHTRAFKSNRYYSSRSLKGHWLFLLELRKYSDVSATGIPGRAWCIDDRDGTWSPPDSPGCSHQNSLQTVQTHVQWECCKLFWGSVQWVPQKFSCQRPLKSAVWTGHISTLYWSSLWLIASTPSHTLGCSSISLFFLGTRKNKKH